MAGVLWNCKRGTSMGKFIQAARKIKPLPPPSDFAKNLMAMGVEMEPVIMKHFTAGMAAEHVKLLPGKDFLSIIPGPFVKKDYPGWMGQKELMTSATPDGLLLFELTKVRYIPFEIKFFASKVEFPSVLPNDYLAQVLMQMMHCGSRVAFLVSAVKDTAEEVLYQIWFLRATTTLIERYEELLEDLFKVVVDGTEDRSRHKNSGEELQEMVVGHTTNCLEAWDFIIENQKYTPYYDTDSKDLRLSC
jgi:hypothetical protein